MKTALEVVALTVALEYFGIEIAVTIGPDCAAQPASGFASQVESDFVLNASDPVDQTVLKDLAGSSAAFVGSPLQALSVPEK